MCLGAGETGSPSEVGQWQPPMEWPVIAIHAALMPTGEVLHYSYQSGDSGSGSAAALWDPQTGLFTPVNFYTNIFCSGLSMLPDGSLYVTGGTRQGAVGQADDAAFHGYGLRGACDGNAPPSPFHLDPPFGEADNSI